MHQPLVVVEEDVVGQREREPAALRVPDDVDLLLAVVGGSRSADGERLRAPSPAGPVGAAWRPGRPGGEVHRSVTRNVLPATASRASKVTRASSGSSEPFSVLHRGIVADHVRVGRAAAGRRRGRGRGRCRGPGTRCRPRRPSWSLICATPRQRSRPVRYQESGTYGLGPNVFSRRIVCGGDRSRRIVRRPGDRPRPPDRTSASGSRSGAPAGSATRAARPTESPTPRGAGARCSPARRRPRRRAGRTGRATPARARDRRARCWPRPRWRGPSRAAACPAASARPGLDRSQDLPRDAAGVGRRVDRHAVALRPRTVSATVLIPCQGAGPDRRGRRRGRRAPPSQVALVAPPARGCGSALTAFT